MKRVYGYIRVSTVKQGTGVSLQEQKDAIIRYAEKHDLIIVEWFEEQETAAKQGRPLFTRMMKLLQIGKAQGVVIHKIDRSARNLKDWASLGDLIDKGVDVHFAHESLDLDTRGGRLAADIQAVIASDYIRNLRDEAKKGLYGRLKQGVYPFGAPVGYLNNGPGQLKTIDPIQGPLVRRAFELYASGEYCLKTLAQTMRDLGLKSSKDGIVYVSTLSAILNNPFYVGIMKIKGKTYEGKHEPLVSAGLFARVQNILNGKCNSKLIKHEFLFRRLVKCDECGYSLIGETRKGHVYYRCHSKSCKTKSVREEFIARALEKELDQIQLSVIENRILDELLSEAQEHWSDTQNGIEESLRMQQGIIKKKLDRLTDAYVESTIDRDTFEQKKQKLLVESEGLRHNINHLPLAKESILKKTQHYLGLLKTIKNGYIFGIAEEKRKIIKTVTSDLRLQGKKLIMTMQSPFQEIANRALLASGDLNRNISRICKPEIADSDNFSREVVDSEELRSSMKELLNSILKSFEGDLMGNEEE